MIIIIKIKITEIPPEKSSIQQYRKPLCPPQLTMQIQVSLGGFSISYFF